MPGGGGASTARWGRSGEGGGRGSLTASAAKKPPARPAPARAWLCSILSW